MPVEEEKQTSTWNVENTYFSDWGKGEKLPRSSEPVPSAWGQRSISKRNRFGREGIKAHSMDYSIDPKCWGMSSSFPFVRKLFLTIASNFVSYREHNFTRREKREKRAGWGEGKKIKSRREAKKLSWKSWEGGNLEVDLWNIFLHSKLLPRELWMSSKGWCCLGIQAAKTSWSGNFCFSLKLKAPRWLSFVLFETSSCWRRRYW